MRGECPEPNRPGCPYASQRGGCFSDLHHKAWRKRDYKTPLEKRYRNLPENKEQLCRFLHDEVHFEPIPIKPTVQEMRDAISGIAIEEWGNDAA